MISETQFDITKLLADHQREPQLVLVSGVSGSGKTSWCLAQVQAARDAGFTAAGLLSLPEIKDNTRTAINLKDLSTGEYRQIASRRPVFQPQAETRKWEFDNDVVAWGNQVLASIEICDLLVIDELGPLELRHNKGFQAAFDLLASQRYRLGIVVVRPSLLDEVLENWKAHTIKTILL